MSIRRLTQDERLTSVEAEGVLREAGVRGPRHKSAVDQVAAVLILQEYLDAHPEARPTA